MRVLQEMLKNQRLLWKLYVGIARNAKKPNDYHGTHMQVLQGMQNVSGYYGTYMRVLQGMQNASGYYGTYMRVLQ